MAFTVPIFNINASVWFPPNTPGAGPFDTQYMVQLYVNPKAPFTTPIKAAPLDLVTQTEIRFSKADFIGWGAIVGTIYGFDDSSGNTRYYKVIYWDTMHQGFVNEYCMNIVVQCLPDGSVPDTSR